VVVCEPRRNRLIAKDGDKDDDIDAEKLAQLLRGGFVKPVHQCASMEQAVFKQQVSLYHYRVRQRVREAQRISALFRQHGVMVRERAFVAADERPDLVKRLPANVVLAEAITLLWQSYDAAVSHEEQWRTRLVKLAQQQEVVRRFEALPGFGWIRASTLFAYLDTPWRFRSKGALWKYLGIGLERFRSGNGPEHVWGCPNWFIGCSRARSSGRRSRPRPRGRIRLPTCTGGGLPKACRRSWRGATWRGAWQRRCGAYGKTAACISRSGSVRLRPRRP
jgi:transposase